MTTLTDQVQADLTAIMGDWGDSMVTNPRTSNSGSMNGKYDRQYVETLNISGYHPTFTCSSVGLDATGLAVNDKVEVTSPLYRITNKKMKVVEIENNGLVALVIMQLSA